MYQLNASCKHTPYIVQKLHRCVLGDVKEKPNYKSNDELLLFSRRVDIGKEKRNIMATNKRHPPLNIVAKTCSFLLITVGCFIRLLTFVNSFVRNFRIPRFWFTFPSQIDLQSNLVNKCLWNDMFRCMEFDALPSRC